MKRKYLEELGINDYWQKWHQEDLDKDNFERYSRHEQQIDETGHCGMECWNLDTTMLENLYELVRIFLEEATNQIDLEYNKFTYQGKEYTQLELIEELIQLLEFILVEPDKCSAEMTERLSRNEYALRYGKYDYWNAKHVELETEVWEIWKLLHKAMWW